MDMDYKGSSTVTAAPREGSLQDATSRKEKTVEHVRRRSPSKNNQCDCGRWPCGPLLANFGAAAWFIFAVNVKFLPNAPFPVIGNVLPTEHQIMNADMAAVVPLLLWTIHFVRRLTEVLFVHKYTRQIHYGKSIGAIVYYWGFGFWIGYSANSHLKYYCPALWLLVPGMVLFVIGEVGNCAVHITQRQMRLNRNRHSLLASERTQRVMPSGALFKLVSCPNYTFEIISWIGFTLSLVTLAATMFLLASVITLVVYAYKKHNHYTELFNGEDGKELYPPKRKALIPFIF